MRLSSKRFKLGVMKSFVLFVLLISFFSANSQIPNRYVEEVFQNVTETNNIVFSTNVPQPNPNIFNLVVLFGGPPIDVFEFSTTAVTLEMDIFQPEGDIASKRPVVILCFGGGFVQGSRTFWSIRLLAQGLARRGYVVASIDYRLGMSLYDQELGARSVYRAIQDSRSAVRFFRANAETYNIDPDNIFIGGHSSGAFVAMHNVYLEREEERPDGTFAGFQGNSAIPDLGCLDCVGDNLGFDGHATAAFNLAGALGDLNFVEDSSEPPLLQFHSSDDGIVPYGVGEPFSNFSDLIIGSDLPVVFGSAPTAQRFNDLNVVNEFNSYTDRGHGVHENGMVALHDDILPKIGSWFFTQFLEPQPLPIAGINALCLSDRQQTYTLPANNFTYFDWKITGGSFTTMSTDNNQVEVLWDESAPMHELSVESYLENGAGASEVSFNVDVVSQATNEWTASTGGLWDQNSNWNLGRVPLTCEDVLISDPGQNIQIDLEASRNYQIRSLQLEDNVLLRMPATSSLTITND